MTLTPFLFRATLISSLATCLPLAAQDAPAREKSNLETFDRAWEIVADSDVAFWLSLARWEAAPSPTTRAGVGRAYDDVLSAWRTAVEEFEVRERTG